MTELVLIRHGETDLNRELRFQGQVDTALNAIGHEQARRVAHRLAGEQVQALYVSDLARALQTAQPIQGELALPLRPDAGLREQSFGLVDGMAVQEIQRLHPTAWDDWLRFDPDFAMPGGESQRQFHARVMDTLNRLAVAHGDGRLIVVTHGGVLDMVYRTARSLGLGGPRQSEIPNGGVNRVRFTPGGLIQIVDWADIRHLADLPPQPVYDQKKYAAPGTQPVASDGKPSAA